MAAPNIVNVATIRGNTNVATLGATTGNIVTNTASSGKVFKINTVFVFCKHKRRLFSKVISMFLVRIHLEPAADNDEGMAGNRG